MTGSESGSRARPIDDSGRISCPTAPHALVRRKWAASRTAPTAIAAPTAASNGRPHGSRTEKAKVLLTVGENLSQPARQVKGGGVRPGRRVAGAAPAN